MLILMKPGFTPNQLRGVEQYVRERGFQPHTIPGEHSTAVGITGNHGRLDPQPFEMLDGVSEAVTITKPYKLSSREFHPGRTEIKVGTHVIGTGRLKIIAGPCAVESEEQTLRIAHAVKAAGADFLRGGAYKPRSSPYSFQGLGVDGLKFLARARAETGLPIVTEALDLKSLEAVCEYVDVIQVGARNMQNFTLLQEVGKTRKPVLLKRGMSATLDELLMATEYIMEQGNTQVILCERGIRSFDSHSRNLLDLTAVPALKRLSHLPIAVDPSHATGKKDQVPPMSCAAVAAGADLVMLDVHDRPAEALCDGNQALHPREFAELVKQMRKIESALL